MPRGYAFGFLGRNGAILEEPRFHPHLTGRENLHIHAAARDKSAHGRVDGALARVLGRRGAHGAALLALLDEVQKTCDLAAIVDNGRVVVQSTMAELTAGGERTIDIVAAPHVKAAGVLAGVPDVLRAVDFTAASGRRSRPTRRATPTSSPRCCAGCWRRTSRSSACRPWSDRLRTSS